MLVGDADNLHVTWHGCCRGQRVIVLTCLFESLKSTYQWTLQLDSTLKLKGNLGRAVHSDRLWLLASVSHAV